MTYRIDPHDEEDNPRDFTLSEVSALLRRNYRAIPDLQYVAFTTVSPELAYLFKHNDES